MSICIVIPSYKRSGYLATALESVKLQTAIGEVERIIVSENSDDTNAKLVCEQFPELKIEFYQQTGELSAVEHWNWIIRQSNSKYTAMLHDDDWWYPTHLECALKSLKRPDCAAYFSNFIFAKNEINGDAYFHHSAILTYFVENFCAFKDVELSFEDVCSLCYLFTPFHMSSIVSKTEILKTANEDGLKFAKSWYADRIFYPIMSLYGKLAFNPQILVSVRTHDNNDSKTINQEERYNSHVEGSLKIKELASKNGVDVLNKWREIKSVIRATQFNEILGIFHIYFGYDNNSMFLVEPPLKENETIRTLKKMVKFITPYGLVRASFKLKEKLNA